MYASYSSSMPSNGSSPSENVDVMNIEMANADQESLYEYNTYHTTAKLSHSSSEEVVALPPARSDSHRSQSRRNAAGHAEMQSSAFHSTQNEFEAQSNSHKSKAPNDEPYTTASTQRPKRPRRFTKETQDMNTTSWESSLQTN